MSRARKFLFASFGKNYIAIVLQLLSSVIIARLLTPHEIGIFSVGIVLIGFAHTFRDSGSTTYIIQEKELTTDKIRAAFALTLISAWLLALAIGLGSGYVAEFYHEPGVRSVMMVLSLNFLLLPFGSVPIAYMHRKMDFKYITLVNIIPNIVSVAATIGFAYSGFSYLSMAWGSVSGTVCTILLVQIWRSKELPFLPGFKGIRNVFSFGMLSNLVMILVDISKGIPDLIIGRVAGMTVVGYFGRSMGLVSMFENLVMRSLWSVALPHFAEQSRSGDSMKRNFLISMNYVTALAGPFFACLGLLAHPVILVLYGEQWEPSVSLLRLLCLSSLITSPFLFLGAMFSVTGKMKQNVYFLSIHASFVGALVLIAAYHGLDALGVAFIGINLVDSIIFFRQCRIVMGVRFLEIASVLRQSAGVTIAAVIPVLILLAWGEYFPLWNLWTELILGVVCSALGWTCGIFLFKHPLKKEIGASFLLARQLLGVAE